MRKVYEISEQEYKQVEEIRKANNNKTLDKKLRVITLRFQGYKNVEIAEIIQYTPNYVVRSSQYFGHIFGIFFLINIKNYTLIS